MPLATLDLVRLIEQLPAREEPDGPFLMSHRRIDNSVVAVVPNQLGPRITGGVADGRIRMQAVWMRIDASKINEFSGEAREHLGIVHDGIEVVHPLQVPALDEIQLRPCTSQHAVRRTMLPDLGH